MEFTLDDLVRVSREASQWPSGEDSLYLEAPLTNIVANWDAPDIRSATLWAGYKRAGDLLLRRVLEEYQDGVPLNLSHLIYPALFCYRHSIELALKHILMFGGRYRKKTHNLTTLWEEARALVVRNFPEISDDELEHISRIVAELEGLDGTSQGLRYPVDRRRRAFFKLPLIRLDLERVHQVMKLMHNFFDAIDSYAGENGACA